MASMQSMSWVDPLALARAVNEDYWVFLYSGVKTRYSGRYSILAHGLKERIESSSIDDFSDRLTDTHARFENAWFGYWGYGLKNSLEQLPADRTPSNALPDLCMMQFAHIYCFDHDTHQLTLFSDSASLLTPQPPHEAINPQIQHLRSNMSKTDYLKKAQMVLEHIANGDVYQANLTRKFYAELQEPVSGFSLFESLAAISPAPYSAFIQLGDSAVISSSPEQFLQISATGHMTSHPIKGSARRHSDTVKDDQIKEALAQSSKNRAENLMITDLMRNDLARASVLGSVKARELFSITTHATIHHMDSQVSAQKKPGYSSVQAMRDCFPPGSMTGAPKLRAIALCSELEQDARGIYSGALGWFGGDGSCDLSVVIRTILLQGRQLEFQVGGGIVADSTPMSEWQETLDKAQAIAKALHITPELLASL